jgi:hypothetical protein
MTSMREESRRSFDSPETALPNGTPRRPASRRFARNGETQWLPGVIAADADNAGMLNERLRAEFVAGAEEDSRRRVGSGLTREELERVLRRYPGDLGPHGSG